MKKTLLALSAAISSLAFAGFTPGNLVVRIVGDGVNTTEPQGTFLQEYTTAGAPVGSEVNLATGGRFCSVTYGETSEGSLELSDDNKFMVFAGYDIAPRDPGFNTLGTPRVIGRYDLTTNAISYSVTFVPAAGDGMRGLWSPDGNRYVVTGGDAGLLDGTFASAPAQVLPNLTSSRNVHMVDGILWFNGSDAYFGGNGFASWDGTNQVELFETPNGASSRNWFAKDKNTVYLCTSTGSQGLMKIVRNELTNTWSLAYQLGGTGVNSIARVGDDIYVTSSNGAQILKTKDNGTGFDPFTTVATASANRRFRGLTTVPGPTGFETITPSGFRVALGRLDSGNLASLQQDDNNFLRVCKFIVPNQVTPPVNVEVEGTTTVANPSSFECKWIGKMVNTGSFQLILELRDFANNAWVNNTTYSVNTTKATRSVVGTAAFTRYIGASGLVRMRYQVRQTGPAGVSLWCVDADQVSWTIGR
ncbi:MAG: hypothetical protein KIT11_03520 [Fimbriimonadaceae bacterium]|nr:hypothetical protein [Fimbriimonadaceae bacterium]QYK57034.1 MAG: hypothetical protein KF733_06005 [Fimbriimonadaceae bacterium]